MASRSWRALTIVLVLASASPPPRVSNALIAAMHRHDPAEAGKTVQSRARNRIGPTVQVATCRPLAELSGGRARPARSSRPFARKIDPSPTPRPIRPPSPAPRATLRLRC